MPVQLFTSMLFYLHFKMGPFKYCFSSKLELRYVITFWIIKCKFPVIDQIIVQIWSSLTDALTPWIGSTTVSLVGCSSFCYFWFTSHCMFFDLEISYFRLNYLLFERFPMGIIKILCLCHALLKAQYKQWFSSTQFFYYSMYLFKIPAIGFINRGVIHVHKMQFFFFKKIYNFGLKTKGNLTKLYF